jgi:hypothetical protein
VTDEFSIDLTGHEITRQALVAEHVDWMAEANARSAEILAWKMLYSNLDEHQQETYDMLVANSILPAQE